MNHKFDYTIFDSSYKWIMITFSLYNFAIRNHIGICNVKKGTSAYIFIHLSIHPCLQLSALNITEALLALDGTPAQPC